MVRKKSGMPQPTSRKIIEHAMKEGKSFLVRNGYAILLAIHTAKGADTMDKTMNSDDIFLYPDQSKNDYSIIYDAIFFVKEKSNNKKGNDVSIIPLKLKKGGIASAR